jgi:hypothetical protein
LSPDEVVSAEPPLREELVGLTLEAVFKWRGVPAAPAAPEVSAPGIAAAQKLTAPTVRIDLTALGRMKLTVTSRALALPFRSEIRARFDRYGHFVLWPNATRYRAIAPGALRTVLGERRVDVTPLVIGTRVKAGAGKVLDLETRILTMESPLGRLRLHLAEVAEAGLGGPLVCRQMVELVGIDPSTPECKPGEIMLAATVDWQDGGGFEFEVQSLERRVDLLPSAVLVPPPGAESVTDGLPEAPDGIFLTKDELANFRTKAIEVKPGAGAPAEGFTAVNGRDITMLLTLDGVPVVAVPALASRYVIGTIRGRYVAQWRTFLGELVGPTDTLELPAVLQSVAAPPEAPDPNP